MKRIPPAAFLLPIAFLLLAGAQAQAQVQILVPFLAKSGIRTAARLAQDSLGDDARLAFVATFGRIEQEPLLLEFNLNNGRADTWGYTFYSPSKGRSMTLGVVQIPLLGFQTQTLGGSLPFPSVIDLELDTTGAYFNSDRLVAQLKQDSTYQRYRRELPDARPLFVSLGHLIRTDSLALPNGFPLDQPTWTLSFVGGGDSSMTCFVASRTGEHFCRRLSLPTLEAPLPEHARGTASLALFPNPAAGRLRVVVTLPDGTRAAGAELALYDELGHRVLDLGESFRASGYSHAEFDTGHLAAGVYYCRASGAGWSGVAGVVVE